MILWSVLQRITIDFMQNISEQLEELERTKKEYIAKNHQQVCSILYQHLLIPKNTIMWQNVKETRPAVERSCKVAQSNF